MLCSKAFAACEAFRDCLSLLQSLCLPLEAPKYCFFYALARLASGFELRKLFRNIYIYVAFSAKDVYNQYAVKAQEEL
jgi:hypothetical protein